MQQMTPQPTQVECIHLAARLLWTIWNGISREYLRLYRTRIWGQFEENVAACARMTNDLIKFVSLLCGVFQVSTVGRSEEERTFHIDALSGFYAPPASLLKVLREHPVVCVTLLRTMKDEERKHAQSSDDDL